MKKIILIILLLMIISIDCVFASSPAKLKNFSSSSTLKQGETVVIDTKVVYGNAVGYPFPYVEYFFNYDRDVFEFVSFKSNYDLSYDSSEMVVKGNNSFILDTHVYNEEEAKTIWTMTFMVKEDAKIGDSFINDQKFLIIENNDINENTVIDDSKYDIYFVTTIIILIIIVGSGLLYIILKTKKA